ncbi:MAG: class I SAM-dependent methyltransferase, partial [Oscillospiraceae bacterium]|nr:class I SAM-dependent methyltransferase [Oscillospiraceae bacterium]
MYGEIKMYIYGAGENGKKLLKEMRDKGYKIDAIIDRNADNINEMQNFSDIRVITLDEAIRLGVKDDIVIVSPDKNKDIESSLREKGINNLLFFKRTYSVCEPPVDEQGDFIRVHPFNHYESPYADLTYVRNNTDRIYDLRKVVRDIDFNEEKQFELLNQINKTDILNWNDEFTEESGLRYYKNNDWFPYSGAQSLFGIMNVVKPKRITEIGSGFSTAVMLDTNERIFDNSIEITCIEPRPDRLKTVIKDTDNISIFEKDVQEIPVNFFENLKENDILFIDSSHVAHTGVDVNYELFEILPRLNKGVIIHFHDI